MYYNDQEDGLGLDLTPLVNAASSGADSYAKIRAADARVAAAKRPTVVQPTYTAPAQRRMNPLAMIILGVVAVGGFFVVRKMMGKRRR